MYRAIMRRRRLNMLSNYRRIKQPVQYFTRQRYVTSFIVVPPGAGATGFATSFKLNDLVNSSEFTQLYDQYMIKGIKVSLIPRYSQNPSAPVPAQGGNVWSVLDYDDVTAPTTIDTLMQYQNVKRTRTHMVHSRYFKPAVAAEIFNTGLTTNYNPKKNVWLDCNLDTTEHYGIKWWVDQTNAGVTLDLQVKMYLAFKNVR